MTAPEYAEVDSSQPVLGEGPLTAALEPQVGPAYSTTERLGLALPPDNADEWGDDYRRAMQALDDYAGRTFIQPTQPTVPGPYLWVQTGLGATGTDFTVWFENGVV